MAEKKESAEGTVRTIRHNHRPTQPHAAHHGRAHDRLVHLGASLLPSRQSQYSALLVLREELLPILV
jgi:hypothetical protein